MKYEVINNEKPIHYKRYKLGEIIELPASIGMLYPTRLKAVTADDCPLSAGEDTVEKSEPETVKEPETKKKGAK